jgi:hypothetical protein
MQQLTYIYKVWCFNALSTSMHDIALRPLDNYKLSEKIITIS